MLNGHGNDIFKYNKIVADFSSNVVPKDYNEKLLKNLCAKGFDLNFLINYPEPDAGVCSKLFEERNHLVPNSVLTLNGSVEGVYLIAETFKKSKTLIFTPTFMEYEDGANRFGHKIIFKSNSDFEIKEGFDLVFLCNPNNPDGKVLDLEKVKYYLKRFSKTLFVMDEAYGELCKGFESYIGLVKKYRNLIVLKSFTKLYSLPGIRLGFLVGSPKMVANIIKRKIPWSVNNIALNFGRIILQSPEDIKVDTRKLFENSEKLKSELLKLKDLKVYPSNTTFFLLKSKVLKAKKLKKLLIQRHKILIRDCSNFRGLTDYHFRISTQTEEKNDLLLGALKEIYG